MSTETTITTQEELLDMVNQMEETLLFLESRLSMAKKITKGRKAQVLKILQSAGHISISSIAQRLGINERNVSSQLTYLRKDGWPIATDTLGRKFLTSDKAESTSQLHESAKSAKAKVITRKAS